MKNYNKPYIEDEEIELEDVIALSGQTEGDPDNPDDSGSYGDYF